MLQKNQFIKILGIGSLCLFLLGCSDEGLVLKADGQEELILKEEAVLVTEEALVEEKALEEAKSKIQETTAQEEKMQIAVHICGAVNQPGVYYFEPEQRIYEGIQAAGGFCEDADMEYLNQAAFLEDGMKIVVPTMEEVQNLKKTEGEEDSLQIGIVSVQQSSKDGTDGKVNLNTADEALLCTLPGIGESRAKSIIAYRNEKGPFEKIEDIMKVSGIKEAAFEKIKDAVIVSN